MIHLLVGCIGFLFLFDFKLLENMLLIVERLLPEKVRRLLREIVEPPSFAAFRTL